MIVITCFSEQKTVVGYPWSRSAYHVQSRLLVALHGLLIQMQFISFRSLAMHRKQNFEIFGTKRHRSLVSFFSLTLLRGGSRIFLGGGALVFCSTSTPLNHIVFFLENTSCIRNCRSSQGGGGCAPLAPSP